MTERLITLNQCYYIEDLETALPIYYDGLPFGTPVLKIAKFTAWALNKHHDRNRFTVRQFQPEPDIINLPYIPQWGPGADQRPGDCGPACVAMIVHGLTQYRPTVDDAATACGQPIGDDPGSRYTNHAQLIKGARSYEIKLASRSKYRPPQLTLKYLTNRAKQGFPSIALIHYGVLRNETNPIPGIIHNQDQNYDRGHWVVFLGATSEGVYIHDPDFWGERQHDGGNRFIPEVAFEKCLGAVAPGCTVAYQGLTVQKE
jgi:hypothetical protein